MAHLYRLVFLALLLCGSAASAALTPTVTAWRFSNTDTNLIWYDKDAACEHWRAKYGYYATRLHENGVSCMAIYRNADGSTYETYGDYLRSVPNQCPANSTLASGICSCNAGYVEAGNSCVLPDPCDGLADYCTANANTEREWTQKGVSARPASVCYKPVSVVVGAGGGQLDRFPGCSRGCNVNTSPGVVKYEDANGGSMLTGYGLFSGGDCSFKDEANTQEPANEDNKAEDPDPTCKTGFKGEVNGVSVCVPAKSSSGVTEHEVTDNGDGTETTKQTSVKCENGACVETKTTETKDKTTGQTVSSSTTQVTVDKADYCSRNKSAGVCKGEDDEDGDGEFGGTCDAGYTCKGDAIQCAIAKKQHEDSCALNKENDASRLFGSEKGKEGSVTGDLPGNETHAMSGVVGSGSRFAASSCISDKQVTVWGKSLTLPFSDICPYLSQIGNVLLVVASIIAVVIVMRGR